MPVRVSRAYDEPRPDDGWRVLVDRVWPRGRSRDQLALDEWLREIAPSDELRRWFGHDPARWDEFRHRYRDELAVPLRAALVERLAQLAAATNVTLVYGARDTEHNQAVALAEVLSERAGE